MALLPNASREMGSRLAMYQMWGVLLMRLNYVPDPDKRKVRRQHRRAAMFLLRGGTLLNAHAPVGSTPWIVSRYHLKVARNYRR